MALFCVRSGLCGGGSDAEWEKMGGGGKAQMLIGRSSRCLRPTIMCVYTMLQVCYKYTTGAHAFVSRAGGYHVSTVTIKYLKNSNLFEPASSRQLIEERLQFMDRFETRRVPVYRWVLSSHPWKYCLLP